MSRRVLHVLANAELGGAERITLLMAANLDRVRYEPAIFFLNDGSLPAETRRMGIPTFVFQGPLRLRNPVQIRRAVMACRKIVLEERIDLLHACMSYSHIISSCAGLSTGRPRVLFQHGPVGGWIDRAANLLPASRVLANSSYTMACHNAISLRRWPIAVVNCSTEFELRAEDMPRYRRQIEATYGVGEDALVLLTMGRFDPWKGIDVGLRAAAPLLRETPSMKYFIVGGAYRHFHPEYESTLRRIVRDEGIEESVVFTGYQKEMLPFLARTDILIHSAVTPEPFGLVILEGMASGAAVVASRAGGPLEIITEGEDGVFHEPGNRDDLEARLRQLVGSEDLRRRLGTNARQTVARRFRPEVMVRNLQAQYDEIFDRKTEVRS